METRRAEAGDGANWYVRGWRLFIRSPVQWVLLFLIPLIAAALLLWMLPRLGSLIVSLLGPLVGAGLYQAARTADSGGEPEFAMLFEGFRHNEATAPLLTLGALALVVSFAMELLGQRLIGSVFYGPDLGGDAMSVPHLGVGTLFALLIGLALELAVAMAFFYAVPLVWFRKAAPLDAIRASLSAGWKNVLPLLIFGLIGSVLVVLAMLPLMLGLPLLLPVMFLAIYYSYRSVFPD
jgi:uncharacterized membrane protein